MKKILILLATLLSFVTYSKAAKTISIQEECEVVTIYHAKTSKVIFKDTLKNHRIIYTEKGVNDYALENIPKRFFDISEKYFVSNEYFNRGKQTQVDIYMIYFDCFMERPESPFSQWKYERVY